MKVRIEKTGINGEGIAYAGHRPVFVPGVFPQEEAEIRISEDHGTWARGTLLRRLTSSPDRIPSPCPHAHTCGACPFITLRYEAQQREKENGLIEALWKYSRTPRSLVRPLHAAPSVLYYRSQLKLPLRMQKGKLVSGMYQPGTNFFTDTAGCPVHEKELEAMRQKVLAVLNAHKMEAYDAGGKTGLRAMVLRGYAHCFQLTLITGRQNLPASLPKDLMAIPGLVSLAQSVNTTHDLAGFFGSHPRILAGRATLPLTMMGLHLELTPDAFFQLNLAQAEALYRLAVSKVDPCGLLVEAYCGIGTMSLLAAEKAQKIIGIEAVPGAVESARRNARANDRAEKVSFLCADAAMGLKDILRQEKVDILLADPPRAGMDDAMLETILSSSLSKIIYVSCSPSTLSRNLAVLKQDFDVRTIIPFDLFPATPLVESIAVLQRRGTTDRLPRQKKKA
jgi:23S rRNA (uracil1939-C5)-methyltransferase